MKTQTNETDEKINLSNGDTPIRDLSLNIYKGSNGTHKNFGFLFLHHAIDVKIKKTKKNIHISYRNAKDEYFQIIIFKDKQGEQEQWLSD